ncbi:MAG: response regulator [Mariprofundus sp.]|nr:response regulator [Mariprofundus sp.]
MGQANILIVDDNPLNLELAGDLLEMESFCVSKADDGAMALAEAFRNPPDLILMDMRMPGMSGLETLLELRQSDVTRDIPVVVLTASVMAGEQERLLQAGFDGFMQKPISIISFADEVRSYLKA